ncbi:WAT1-related protein At5g64700-like [Oryza brachyantha]|uniref:WAT1-related protein At5g64700-like n=1 Tax=Oryza brachyantha TaxID=4533 RepID=UPI0003EAE47D|nr:WAT1-related protein At5g64700-like [Oryza brachyantha]
MGSTVPHGVAFLIRFIYGVMQILTKVAFTQGTSTSVLVFYRHIVATAVLLPVTLVVERKTAPPLSFKVSLKLFVHALYGMSASMNISSIGLNYASATSASAVQNLVPVLTFFLAVLLGVESLKLKMHHGVVKVSGIVFCAVGVTVLALYQGPDLKSFINHHLFPHTNSAGTHSLRNWILGIFLQSFATLMWALWAVLQGPLLEEYPSKLLNTTLQIVFATVQSFFMALVLERDFSRWKLGFDVGLVAIIYCGIVVSAISYYLQVWVIDKRGPVFLCMTVPLTLVITIILSLLIGEAVTLGSIISGALMVAGLYIVLWGKRIEQAAISSQGGHGEETARSDLEEQETAAAAPESQEGKDKIDSTN